jgi:NPCBM-associated, NEW3 domain of alpha-galactosidase
VDCGTQVLCSSGTLSEYGDGFDSMGASTYSAPHFNAFQKERLGWLNSGVQPPITTVTSSGTYQLSPYEVQDGSPKALKILQSGSSSSYYYLEFRQAQGFDAFLSNYTDVMSGLVLHFASSSNANSSDLLDLTPTSPATFSHPALVLGQSYTDTTLGATITPTAVSSTGATVQVSLAAAVCTSANPTVSLSPLQSAYVTSGTPVNFTLTVKDNDSSACAPATFSLAGAIPSGWTGVWSTSALSLSPGASASSTLTVTSPAGTPDGFYNVGVSATNASFASYTASAAATYVISTPAPLSVAVTTNQSSYLPGQTVSVIVTVLSGTSPDSGASVTVNITSPIGKTTGLNGTTGSSGTISFSYKLSKRAAAGTYRVQAGTTSTGASATMGASTSFVVQ